MKISEVFNQQILELASAKEGELLSGSLVDCSGTDFFISVLEEVEGLVFVSKIDSSEGFSFNLFLKETAF